MDGMGKRLRELRGDRRQAEIASALGIGNSSYTMYENDQREPNYKTLVAIADYYGVTTDYLLCRSNTKTTNADIRSVCDSTGLSEVAVSCLFDFKKMCKENVPSLKRLKEYFQNDKQILHSPAFRYLVFLDNLIRHRSLLSIAHGTFEIVFESRNKRAKEDIEQEYKAFLEQDPTLSKYLFSSPERIAYLEYRNAIHASAISHDLCCLLLDDGYLGVSANDIINNYVRDDDFAET